MAVLNARSLNHTVLNLPKIRLLYQLSKELSDLHPNFFEARVWFMFGFSVTHFSSLKSYSWIKDLNKGPEIVTLQEENWEKAP